MSVDFTVPSAQDVTPDPLQRMLDVSCLCSLFSDLFTQDTLEEKMLSAPGCEGFRIFFRHCSDMAAEATEYLQSEREAASRRTLRTPKRRVRKRVRRLC